MDDSNLEPNSPYKENARPTSRLIHAPTSVYRLRSTARWFARPVLAEPSMGSMRTFLARQICGINKHSTDSVDPGVGVIPEENH